MDICIIRKDISEIGLIKPLWEQLNSVHIEKSIYFKNKYEKFTFDDRIESIYKKAQNGIIMFDMILDREIEQYVGYCLSSIEDHSGEIDSIFIEESYRKHKLGHNLMKNALEWFESNSIKDIKINVVYANDEALSFYEKYGFCIGNYILKRV